MGNVKTIVTTSPAVRGTGKKAPTQPASQIDLAILMAVEQFHYLTANQVSRLLYPGSRDQDRTARRRLAGLAKHAFLMRLTGLPTPRTGSAPHVFTLGAAGRALLKPANRYYRPGEERAKAANALFMDHTLAVVDVLIAAELLCRTGLVSMPRVLTERQLRVNPVRVSLPAGEDRQERSVAVIPDAWFELSVNGRKPIAISLELDRATEYQQRWRGKVAALAAWATGPYRQAFANPSLTIAVVTPDAARRDTLRSWTRQELARLGQPELAEIFLFTSADPATTEPAQFFFGGLWYEPATREPVSLLVPPKPAGQVIPLPGREVWQGEG